MTPLVDVRLIVAVAGLVLVGGAVWALGRWSAARRWGSPIALDDGAAPALDLIDEALGLIGRPDELRRSADGRVVPVEIKSRRAPASGVFASHRVQVEVYCLLVESTYGRPPPYGVVVYAGGESRLVPWGPAGRAEVLRLLGQLRRPYDGRADPGPRKCAGCRWRPGCDARAS